MYFPSKILAIINFSISNPAVNSEDEIEVQATISGLIISSCSTGGCYLQAELQSAGGYFGYTYNNSGEYVDYFKNPSSTDEIKSKLYNFIPVGGNWTGKLKAKNNPSNPNYYGPGDYILSFRRFSGNSLTATNADSNSVQVTLALSAPNPTPTDISSIPPTPTPTPISFVLKTASPTNIPTQQPTPQKTTLPIRTILPVKATPLSVSALNGASGEILGTESAMIISPSADPTLTNNESGKKSANSFPFLPVVLVVLGLSFIAMALFSIIKGAKKDYTGGSEKENSDIS